MRRVASEFDAKGYAKAPLGLAFGNGGRNATCAGDDVDTDAASASGDAGGGGAGGRPRVPCLHAALARCMRAIGADGWPPVFVFLFDEPWLLFAHVAFRVLMHPAARGAVLGAESDVMPMPDFWAFRVSRRRPQHDGLLEDLPQQWRAKVDTRLSVVANAGWRPHRDRPVEAGYRPVIPPPPGARAAAAAPADRRLGMINTW